MPASSSKILINMLAAIVIAGFILVITFSARFSAGSGNEFGPTVLETDARDHAYLNIGTTLYHLDDRGQLLDKIPLQQLGIEDIHLTELLARDDGTLLIGTGTGGDVFSCNLQLRRCESFLVSGARPVSSFKMTWDSSRNRLIVTDGERHRILVYDEHGKYLSESKGGEGGLRFPNTPLLLDEEEVVIADTNNHRLVALDAETLNMKLWEIPVENSIGNFRRIWPTDMIRVAGDRFWVIIDNDMLENGDVILFDSLNKPVKRVDLPADWDPIKMRMRSRDVLLAGFGSVELVTVSLDGETVQPFGGEVFRSELLRTREIRHGNDRWWDLWIWVAIIPLVILAGSVAWLDWQRRQAQALEASTAQRTDDSVDPAHLPETEDGIYWLKLKPAAVKLLRNAHRGMLAVPVLVLISMAMLGTMGGLEKSGGLMLIVLAVLVPFMAMSYVGLSAMQGGRLGVTDDRIVLAGKGRPHSHFFPRQLVYGNNFISSGEITVFTRTGKGPIYDETEMQNYVEPRLGQARKLNMAQGYIYLLREGERFIWVTTIAIACMTGVYIYAEFFMK